MHARPPPKWPFSLRRPLHESCVKETGDTHKDTGGISMHFSSNQFFSLAAAKPQRKLFAELAGPTWPYLTLNRGSYASQAVIHCERCGSSLSCKKDLFMVQARRSRPSAASGLCSKTAEENDPMQPGRETSQGRNQLGDHPT